MKPSTKTTTIRLPVDLLASLDAYAVRERRSLNSAVRVALESFLQDKAQASTPQGK